MCKTVPGKEGPYSAENDVSHKLPGASYDLEVFVTAESLWTHPLEADKWLRECSS
jgi:hypothetical protein